MHSRTGEVRPTLRFAVAAAALAMIALTIYSMLPA
jgi:hypothetical protein